MTQKPPPPDVAALTDTLTAEYAAIFAYGAIGAALPAEPAEQSAAAREALADHRRGRDWLRAQLAARHADQPAPAAAYGLPDLTQPGAAAKLAADVELSLVPRWAKTAGTISQDLRGFCARNAQACGRRAATWGAPSSAFPGTTTASPAPTDAAPGTQSPAPSGSVPTPTPS